MSDCSGDCRSSRRDFLVRATGALAALPNLGVAVVIFLLAGALTSGVNTFMRPFMNGEAGTGWLDRDTARPTRNIAVACVWIFAIAMACPYLPGAQSEAFKGLSVLVGLMISLGSTSIVGQAANGLYRGVTTGSSWRFTWQPGIQGDASAP